MSIVKFESHLRDPAPGFRCFACEDRKEKPTLLARVKHRIGKPATPQALVIIEDRLGTAVDHLRSFYERHDGVLLYRDTRSAVAGVEFFKSRDWERKTAEMHSWAIEMETYQDMPDWFRQGIAFGEICHSANYFVIQTQGKGAGQICYADHDDFHPDPIARNLDSFLATIVADPAAFLNECGCYTRYSDGKTDTQWIPKEYIADCGNYIPDGSNRGRG